MKIIDFHNHVYPEKIARKATDAVGAFYNMSAMERTGTVEELFSSHKAAGIDTCVVHAVATVFFLWIISKPMLEKLDRIKVKYGLLKDEKI